MKKWTGGSIILILAFLLLLCCVFFPLSTTAATTAAAIAASSPSRSHPPPPPPPFSPKPRLLPSLPGLDVLFPSPNSTRSPQLDPSSKLAHTCDLSSALMPFPALLTAFGRLQPPGQSFLLPSMPKPKKSQRFPTIPMPRSRGKVAPS